MKDSWLIDGEALIQKFEKFEIFKNGGMNKSCLKLILEKGLIFMLQIKGIIGIEKDA